MRSAACRLLSLLMLLLPCAFASAQSGTPDDETRVGNVIGKYIGSVQLLASLKNSRCSFAVERDVDVGEAIQDVLNDLSEEEASGLEALLPALIPALGDYYRQLIDDAFANRRQLDDKSLCGILLTTATLLENEARSDWRSTVAARKQETKRRAL